MTTKIGVSLSIPVLDKILKPYRNKYDKHSDVEPHMTVYLSDYKGHNDVKSLVKALKKHPTKVVIDRIIWNKRITMLNVQNWKDFSRINRCAVDVFGEEKYKNNLHITIGYNVMHDEYNDIMKNIGHNFPMTVEGTAFKIVVMKGTDAKEYYV